MKPSLYIKPVKGKGRGVFAAIDFPEGVLIEICPMHIIPGIDSGLLNQTGLADYFFHYSKEEGELAMVLGFGSLYNHAVYPNSNYEIDREEKCMRIYSLKPISAGTEITFNYSGEPGNPFTNWFEARGLKQLT